ncbi:MAG: hypothetical protein RQ728_10195 [Brevefilum sp.]|nr:hypothetical protein [Brevefilum sp.]MDT8382607.1 hypothetical protein [Brevefilum sp.]MDW7754777.1 hypothetical protein [Brevefilum sp.]
MDMKRDLKKKDAYFSYLLRIWQLSENEESPSNQILWRVSLESTQTRTRVMFTSLEDLIYFLQDQLKPKDQTSSKAKDKPL